MNPTQTNSHLTTDCPTLTAKGDSSRCQYRYSNGKRCRLSDSESQLGLCSHHFRLSAAGPQSPSDSLDLSADLLPELSGSGVRADLRQFLIPDAPPRPRHPRPRHPAPRFRSRLHHQPTPSLSPRSHFGNTSRAAELQIVINL